LTTPTETEAAPRAPLAGPAAILLATAADEGGGPAAAQPWEATTLLGRLRAQLAELGIADVTIVARPEWADALGARPAADLREELRAVAELAGATAGGVVVAHAEVVTDTAALARLVAAPAATLTATRPGEPAVQVSYSRVVAAASGYHRVARPSGVSLGVLKADGAALAAAARALAALDDLEGDAVALLLVALVRRGERMRAADLRAHFFARPLTGQALADAEREHAARDEDRARLDSAVKANDGFFTTFFVSPYSRHVARWAARRGLTPNAVTALSMGIGLLAAAAFATGDRAGLIAGAVLLQVAFAADCVDGQLARYTRRLSAFGAWLDSVFDRAKEYAVYAGLALGGDVWLLAAGALALQTFRHAVQHAWEAEQLQALDSAVQPPLAERGEAGAFPPPAGRLVWLRKILVLPIGERFAVISLAAALSGARTAFAILLVWGGFAAAYELAGRAVRSR
jgi:phosphatidylglycerophosphate synthase